MLHLRSQRGLIEFNFIKARPTLKVKKRQQHKNTKDKTKTTISKVRREEEQQKESKKKRRNEQSSREVEGQVKLIRFASATEVS